MADKPEIKCKVDCPCGWTEVFSRAFSGLQIECPGCGKAHRIPTFDEPAADEAIDMSAMEKLLQGGDAPSPVTVPFKQLFLLALVVALLVSAVALPLLWNRWPVNAAVVGGALSWPLAISVAWWGQRRHVKKSKAAS